MNRKTIAATAALAMMLTACAGKPAAQQPDASGAQTDSSSPAATNKPESPAPSTSASPSPAASPVQTAKAYKMTKNYDIVPIDAAGNKKVVLLTFDDGPKEKDMVEPMLDTLDKHKAKAIFFVNGFRIKAKPELLKMIHDRGQVIGNHTYSHDFLPKLSDAKVDEEFDRTQQIINDTVGVTPVFFRPPNGASTEHLNEKLVKEKMMRMNWSNGSLDWADNQKKPDGVVETVMKQLRPGSNILMHELPWTVKALDKLLTKLEEAGYGFVDPNSIDTEPK